MIAEIAMIGTTGSAPISGTSTSGIKRAGAIAGKTADDGGQQRHAANQHELAERNVGEAGENVHSR